mgnify:CR=1 FL=1
MTAERTEKLEAVLDFLFVFSGWYFFVKILQEKGNVPVEFVAEKSLLCVYGIKSFFKERVSLEVLLKGFLSYVVSRIGKELAEVLIVELKKLLKGHEYLLEEGKGNPDKREQEEIYEKIFVVMEMARNFCEQGMDSVEGVNKSLEGLLKIM